MGIGKGDPPMFMPMKRPAAEKSFLARSSREPAIPDSLRPAKRGLRKLKSSTGFHKCVQLLDTLERHPDAETFMHIEAGDGEKSTGIATLKQRLKTGMYESSKQMAEDGRKLWRRCWRKYLPGSPPFVATTRISNYFDRLIKGMGEVDIDITSQYIEAEEIVPPPPPPAPMTDDIAMEMSRPLAMPFLAPAKPVPPMMMAVPPTMRMPMPVLPAPMVHIKVPMSAAEKNALRRDIMRLPDSKMEGLFAILRSAMEMPAGAEEVEFDLDKLPIHTCRELSKYVKQCLVEKGTEKKLVATAVVPARNVLESGRIAVPEKVTKSIGGTVGKEAHSANRAHLECEQV